MILIESNNTFVPTVNTLQGQRGKLRKELPNVNSWNKIFLEKVVLTRVVKKFPVLSEPEIQLKCYQGPATDPYPELQSSTPYFSPV